MLRASFRRGGTNIDGGVDSIFFLIFGQYYMRSRSAMSLRVLPVDVVSSCRRRRVGMRVPTENQNGCE